jgi:sodium/potassium-transporting ATPase subunit alpha
MVVTNIYTAGEEHTPDAARDLMTVLRSDNNVTTIGKKREDVMDEVRLLSSLCNAAEFDA